MIELLSAPSLKLEYSKWTLVLWYCEPFDRMRSFRTLLSKICSVLQEERPAHLSLPPPEDNEDFVEGVFSWGHVIYDVYFEYSLGYLQLSNSSEAALREMASVLGHQLTWRDGSNTLEKPA